MSGVAQYVVSGRAQYVVSGVAQYVVSGFSRTYDCSFSFRNARRARLSGARSGVMAAR